MKTLRDIGLGFFRLYRDGFRNMTWGKPLMWLIALKLIILFAVLRVFFFRPTMAGLSDEEKSACVSERLIGDTELRIHGNTDLGNYGNAE